jgi:hypothetical protein
MKATIMSDLRPVERNLIDHNRQLQLMLDRDHFWQLRHNARHSSTVESIGYSLLVKQAQPHR